MNIESQDSVKFINELNRSVHLTVTLGYLDSKNYRSVHVVMENPTSRVDHIYTVLEISNIFSLVKRLYQKVESYFISIDSIELEAVRLWSERTFGRQRLHGVIDHLKKEIVEVEEDPTDLKEWIDIVILGFDGAMRTGASSKQVLTALKDKWEINRKRTWNTSGDPNKAFEHDRTKET